MARKSMWENYYQMKTVERLYFTAMDKHRFEVAKAILEIANEQHFLSDECYLKVFIPDYWLRIKKIADEGGDPIEN